MPKLTPEKIYEEKLAARARMGKLLDFLLVALLLSPLFGYLSSLLENPAFFDRDIVHDVLSLYPDDTDSLLEQAKNMYSYVAPVFIFFIIIIVNALLRIIMLTSPFASTPGYWLMGGLYIAGQSHHRPALWRIVLYEILDLLPLYLCAILYVLYMVTSLLDPSVLAALSFSIKIFVVALFTQFTFVIFQYFLFDTRRLGQRTSGIDISCTPRNMEKLQHRALRAAKSRFSSVIRKLKILFKGLVTAMLVVVFGFETLIIVRGTVAASPVMKGEESIYNDQEMIWKDNAYFALQGLNAPEEITDHYRYGRQYALRKFKLQQELKGHAGLGPVYSKPGWLQIEPEYSQHFRESRLRMKKPDNPDGWCYVQSAAQQCSSLEKQQKFIAQNKTLWQRFHKLPDYSKFSVPPVGGRYEAYIIDAFTWLTRFQADAILNRAGQGEIDSAFREWFKFAHLYSRGMRTATTLVQQSVLFLAMSTHYHAFSKLVARYPGTAIDFYKEFRELENANRQYHTAKKNIFMHEWRRREPLAISATGTSSRAIQRIRQCMKQRDRFLDLPFSKIEKRKDWQCPAVQKYAGDLTGALLKPFYTPAIPLIDAVWYYTILGPDLSQSHGTTIHIGRAKLNMIALAIEALKEDVTTEKMKTYVRDAPERLQNPLTNAPFQWNPRKNNLYYKYEDDKYVQHVPLDTQ